MILIVLLIILVARGAHAASSLTQPEEVAGKFVCKIDDCQEMSKLIHGNMDRRVKPCDNFYEHSCNRNMRRSITWLEKIFHAKLSDFLESVIDGQATADDRNTERIRKFYQSCKNRGPNELRRFVSALQVHAQMMDAENYDWSDMLISLTRQGFVEGQLFEVGRNLDQNQLEVS